jgi:hypothetical protein
VPPAIGDAYCGPAARIGVDGCAFLACAEHEVLDGATGDCLPRRSVATAGAIPCGDGGAPVAAFGRLECVAADAACPRGTRLAAGATCQRPPSCPPGSLVAAGEACRPVVTVGARGDLPRVDLGAWAALVLGADGGPGTSDLCRPLALRPDSFGLPPGGQGAVRVFIELVVPDQDITRVHARVRGELSAEAFPRPLSPEAEAVVRQSVATLVEPLRGLGGEASTAMVEVQVSCKVESL